MGKPHTKILSLISLVVFLAFTSFVGFCHVEWGAERDAFCPACKFQKSSIATGTVELVEVPQPEQSDFVSAPAPLVHVFEVRLSSCARAPPPA